MDKFKKFLILGIFSTASQATLASDIPDLHKNHFYNIAQKVLKVNGFNSKKTSINFIVENNPKTNDTGAYINLLKQTCGIEIHLDEQFNAPYMGSDKNDVDFKSISGIENENQKNLLTEFVVMHEISHCKLYSDIKPFRMDDKSVENFLNKYFQYGRGENPSKDASIYQLLQENFSDANAAIQLIRLNGASKDVLTVLQKIQIMRAESEAANISGGIKSHMTSETLNQILKEDVIKQILEEKDDLKLSELASKIATTGTMITLKKQSNNPLASFNADSILIGATNLFKVIAVDDLNFKIPFENKFDVTSTMAYKIAKSTYDTFKPDLFNKPQINQDEIPIIIQENKTKFSELINKNFLQELEKDNKSGFIPHSGLINYLNSIPQVQKESVREIKLSAEQKIANIKLLSEKFSNNLITLNSPQMQKITRVDIKDNVMSIRMEATPKSTTLNQVSP